MPDLASVIDQLQAKLERFRREGLKETPTRMLFVDPILEALGWDLRDPDEVQLEYPTVDNKSVDYALKINGKAALLVEAKALNDSLGDVKDVTQTTGYAANDGIVWCILTNGVRWRVYRSIERCPAPEKLMYEVSYDSISSDEESREQILQKFTRFSRAEVAKGTLDELGEQTFTDGKVRKALSQLVNDAPNGLLRLVRKATGDSTLRPQTIKDSLKRVLFPMLGAPHSDQNRQNKTSRSTRSDGARKSWETRRHKGKQHYAEVMHVSGKPREVVELFQRLDQFCLGLESGVVRKIIWAKCIAYVIGKRTFCSVNLNRSGLRIWLNSKFHRLNGLPSFARDVSKVGHWGSGDIELAITDGKQLADSEQFIREVFELSHP